MGDLAEEEPLAGMDPDDQLAYEEVEEPQDEVFDEDDEYLDENANMQSDGSAAYAEQQRREREHAETWKDETWPPKGAW